MANIFDIVKGWSTRKKIILISSVVMAIASLILIISWSQAPTYQVLFANLSESDAGSIVNKLQELKEPYKLTSNTILVQTDRVYDLRLKLAAQGLPQGGGVGFEVFDKTNFQVTDFMQKLNYRRALEGELSRTILSLTEIDRARVHLAIPEKSLFIKEQEPPTASILVALKHGRVLAQSQIQGIVHLVSSSVEGLNPKNVTIVDNNGDLLTKPVDDAIGLTATQLEYQKKFEKDVEIRIKDILEPVIGKSRVRARVTADIDFSRTDKTEEKFDPEGQVARSEQTVKEKSTTMGPGGVPGVQSNLPGKATAQAQGSQTQSQKQSETINYEITKVTNHTQGQFGNVKKLSAAVLVDGVYTATAADTKDAKGAPVAKEVKYTARTDDEIKRYEELVKKAIGFTLERGDQVAVINMQFEPDTKEVIPPPKRDYVQDGILVAKYLAPLVVALLFLLFVVRPIIKTLTTPPAPPKAAALPYPKTVAELEREMKKKEEQAKADEWNISLPPSEELPIKRQMNEWSQWVMSNPASAAQIVKEWIEGEEA
ncbi:MAG: flagellar basal-body MS-ring/collar protein FliF [Candidatus Magnetobacterium sp. LHC-1]|uniref:Flagellar M-ring protein n=1 Tax=Candidatus Magnetobacterium casense TaxID=1455061 RepID=A0ABS6RU37_9BACT|nr:flagellar basal-body MS-ring/collar protein FliF [Candidatus Magnetobacterium casensis]MBF0608126.1 flagellar M-ring protein FliF [Nitrospirota bacterium]MBV6340138.1 flagellar M-ring protein FliF [Candidatus Magnetobacterium casensis]